ncbi:MAG: HAMP domain-containing sensor histidine kinase, partial [Cyclobacteriaceae bacterium]
NVNELIDRISKSAEIGPYEEIVILTEEVELRYEEILDATLQAQKDKDLRNTLISGVIIVMFIAVIIVIRSQFQNKAAAAIEEKQAVIEERNQKLEDLNNEKNNLIKVLAHDLRAPIAQILGFSRLMMENEKMPTEEREMIGYMAQASERLRQMIGKILDVDAIESGKMNIKMETVALSHVFSSVQKDFKEHAAKKQITIQDISENKSFKVKADQVYLIQIVENLVSNALKFSMPGTSINFDTEDEGDRVVISITDQGPGFTPEDEQKIFKKYQRLSAQSTGGEPSTGLGLSIVKSFTEMMNGAVSYRTVLGKGTTFYIRLTKA